MDSVAKSFKEFKEALKNHEVETFTKFNVYTSPKGFLDEKSQISADMKMQWKDGLPYFNLGHRIYTCHQGKDKNLGYKKKYIEKKKEKIKSDPILEKMLHLKTCCRTKKLDCPASIKVSRIYAFPQFKLENPTKGRKQSTSEKIKIKIEKDENFKGEEAFWFTLPSVEEHRNHPTGEISATAEPVDPVVHSKTKEIVCEGKRNTSVISEFLEIFVTNDLQQNDMNLNNSYCKETEEEIMQVDDVGIALETNNEENQERELNGELEKRGSTRRKLINTCNSHLRNISSVLCMLPEKELISLEENLMELAEKMQKKTIHNESTGLPLENIKVQKVKTSRVGHQVKEAVRNKKQYSNLKTYARKGLSERVGMKATVMKKTLKITV